jgi:hypothetical protein
MSNFTSDDQAVVTGLLTGMLMKSGIQAYPAMDDEGNYIPVIRLRLDLGHARLMTVELEVRAVEEE